MSGLDRGRLLENRNARRRAGAIPPSSRSVSRRSVRKTVRRAVEVVGTLAAVDQVTVSSETDGKVSRILADLGDRVQAGQPLIELDREKRQYNLDQQKARARTRARAVRRRRPGASAGHRADARRAESGGGTRSRRNRRIERASELLQAAARAAADARRRRDDAAGEAGQLRRVAAEREEPARRASTRPKRA